MQEKIMKRYLNSIFVGPRKDCLNLVQYEYKNNKANALLKYEEFTCRSSLTYTLCTKIENVKEVTGLSPHRRQALSLGSTL